MKKILIALLIFLCGCATEVPSTYIDVSPSDNKADVSEIRSFYVEEKNPMLLPIHNYFIVFVETVDGKNLAQYGETARTNLFLKPGEHTIGVFTHKNEGNGGGLLGGIAHKMAYDAEVKNLYKEVKFNFLPGKIYMLSYKRKDGTGALSKYSPDNYSYSFEEKN